MVETPLETFSQWKYKIESDVSLDIKRLKTDEKGRVVYIRFIGIHAEYDKIDVEEV